ncbi:energy transducer TonB [Hymenobacter sp. HSC-4F20]|uniref:energy transducer TonB n=1 Tax=Hymenobacter sp. HSC-4F20 TaxID=2864135 RepID=UPI001C738F0A|nr:M56 family metallopeptidase [Hymenobacter sp. HSC-4F20]MBX0292646.1 energy transducer TonB [Hymenobacter sp. HSC-4F20]
MLTLLPPTMTLATLLSWLLHSSLLLGAGWLMYYLVLRHERCFHYNRCFLLLAPWLALVLPPVLEALSPLLLSVLPAWGRPAGSSLLGGSLLLPSVQVVASGSAGGSALPDALALLPMLYAGVVLLLLARLAGQLLQLWLTARRWPRQVRAGYTVLYTTGQRPVSSFGRWIFWDETAPLAPAEAELIFAHEVAHVQQGHSWERLLLEVVRALLWACPFVHLFPRALALTHELLADFQAIEQAPSSAHATAESYTTLLARMALRQLHPDLPLRHSFTQSFTLTRIRMLTSQSPVRRWKQWLALPLGAVLLLTMACEKAAEPNAPAATTHDELVAPPPPPPPAEEAPAPPPPPPPAYFYVEQMPEYAGGQEQLVADLSKLAKYPAAAKAEKLSGRVFVGFVVAADGTIQGIHLKKGIEFSVKYPGNSGKQMSTKISTPGAQALNEAALNAIRSLPGKWTPGRQDGQAVAVMYTAPISFSLK